MFLVFRAGPAVLILAGLDFDVFCIALVVGALIRFLAQKGDF